MNYGIQMYSIKDVASVDLKLALKTVADLGYKYVEFAGFFDKSAEDVKSWLDEYGLTVTGTHTGLGALAPDVIAQTVAYHKAIGCDYIIVPAANWSTKENLDNNISAMCYAYEYLKNEGIGLGFHNHSGELLEQSYGIIPLFEIIERTPLDIEPDVFFFSNVGMDPIEFCEKYNSRIKCIHMKDGTYPTDIKRTYANPHEGIRSTPCGTGYVPILDVARFGVKNGKTLIVEVESGDRGGPEVVAESIKYLIEKDGEIQC